MKPGSLHILVTANYVINHFICLAHALNYSWHTSEWGPCHGGDCGWGAWQVRNVMCFDSKNWVVAETYCSDVPKPAGIQTCFKLCEGMENDVNWKIGHWSGCTEVVSNSKSSPSLIESCQGVQRGLQTRSITCHLKSPGRSRKLPDEVCAQLQLQPVQNRSCLLPCPQDCVTGNFSDWTSCEYCGVGFRSRYRSVLVAPSHGGQACPVLSEIEPCPDTLPSHWQPESHQETQIQESQQSHSCVHSEVAHKHFKLEVGAWGACEPLLKQQQQQKLKKSSQPRMKKLFKRHHPLRHEKRRSSKLKSLSSRSDGQLQLRTVVKAIYASVQLPFGVRRRRVKCTAHNGSEMNMRFCRQPISVKKLKLQEMCILPRSCALSEWSEWSLVNKSCRLASGAVLPPIRTRSRDILHMPLDGGKPCPDSPGELMQEEAVVANSNQNKVQNAGNLTKCSTYHWYTGPWSLCSVQSETKIDQQRCGAGIRQRNVTCVLKDVHPLSAVPDIHCSQHIKPRTVEICPLPCPEKNCELSSWSGWASCVSSQGQFCSSGHNGSTSIQGFRTRHRHILKSTDADDCPALHEGQHCLLLDCYRWEEQSGAPVKPGIIEFSCHNHLGEKVDDEFCALLPAPKLATTTKLQSKSNSCEGESSSGSKDCSRDCVFNEWTEWSKCSFHCYSEHSNAATTPGFRFRNRTVSAYSVNPARCTELDLLYEQKDCLPRSSCDTFSWILEPWSQCRRRNGSSSSGQFAEESRKIWCAVNWTLAVSEEFCSKLPLPAASRDCPLSMAALIDKQEATMGSISLVQMLHVTTLSTNHSTQNQIMHRWIAGAWSDCMTPPGELCGPGIAHREAFCADGSGSPVSLNHCALQKLVPPRRTVQCFHDCTSACAFTTWSEFEPCLACPKRTLSRRTRELVGSSRDRLPCRSLALEEVQSCTCAKEDSVRLTSLSSWTDCILEPMKTCGSGVRYRTAACIGKNGVILPLEYCSLSGGIETESCEVPCKPDCVWSTCSTPCGMGTRRKIDPISDKSDNCSSEIENCFEVCTKFKWSTPIIGQCIVYERKAQRLGTAVCGMGKRVVQTRCVNEETDIEVSEDLCDPLLKLSNVSEWCYLPCPGECVLSDWSEWESCDCANGGGFSTRIRRILRQESVDQPPCGHLEEKRNCKQQCGPVQWKYSQWSPCIHTSSAGVAGVECPHNLTGTRSRKLLCVRESDRRILEEFHCFHETQPIDTLESASCCVFPNLDCMLSDWTEWTQCPTCDKGDQYRYRSIVQTNLGAGASCPSLQDVRPCPYFPCTQWKASKWGPCTVDAGDCGYGTRQRNISCVTTSGSLAAEEYCNAESKPRDASSCIVPCIGECMYSEWSSWSHCHRSCGGHSLLGNFAAAYQTRSKALIFRPELNDSLETCQDSFIETQPCFTPLGYCTMFNWTNINGQKVCVRSSDGLPVSSGGCLPLQSACNLPCETAIKNSVCQNAICVCPPGLTASYAPDSGALRFCSPQDQESFDNPDPKESAAHLLISQRNILSEEVEISEPLTNIMEIQGTRPKSVPSNPHWAFLTSALVITSAAVIIAVVWTNLRNLD